MAYLSQETKKKMVPAIKAVLKKFAVKATISVSNHSMLKVTLTSGPFDFDDKFGKQINHYFIADHYHGHLYDFFNELVQAMNVCNHDRSDIQTDYFDVGYYISVQVGKWNKPYKLVS